MKEDTAVATAAGDGLSVGGNGELAGGRGAALIHAEIEHLREVCAENREELMAHRQALEQCLEIREGVMELLTHREALAQCLELREGFHAVLGGAKLIGEIGDRTAELDLSLAGVSDNTARHGKAISTLTEQQKRTAATLEVVVRAVKRLAGRSRSRSRSFGGVGSGCTEGSGGDGGWSLGESGGGGGASAAVTALGGDTLACSRPSSRARGRRRDAGDAAASTAAAAAAAAAVPVGSGGEGFGADGGGQLTDWPDGSHGEEEVDGEAGIAVGATAGRAGGYGDMLPMRPLPATLDEWDWSGGIELECDDQRHQPSEGEPRYAGSGSSSCGSDARAWRNLMAGREPPSSSSRRRGGSGHGRGSGRATAEATGGSYPDVLADLCFGGHIDYRSHHPYGLHEPRSEDVPRRAHSGQSQSSRHSQVEAVQSSCPPSAEMASCVKGVLARIEEALTKLDSGGSGGGYAPSPSEDARAADCMGSCAGALPLPGRAPRSWDATDDIQGAPLCGAAAPAAAGGRRSGGAAAAAVDAPPPRRPRSARGVGGMAPAATPRGGGGGPSHGQQQPRSTTPHGIHAAAAGVTPYRRRPASSGAPPSSRQRDEPHSASWPYDHGSAWQQVNGWA